MGLILGGLIGGSITFFTPQGAREKKYKENLKISEEEVREIKYYYENYQLLQNEVKHIQAEIQRLKAHEVSTVIQRQIEIQEQLLTERSVILSDYYITNIKGLVGDKKEFYKELVEENGQVEKYRDEISFDVFLIILYLKMILLGLFAGTVLILLGISISYCQGDKTRTGEDFAKFSNSILLADFSVVSKNEKVDVVTRWGYKLRGMNKKSAEDVLLFATEYVEAILTIEGLKKYILLRMKKLVSFFT